ncbi:MAG TPA: chromosomal replication initiator protein DnaA [Aggregatilineales bacterium]|nr:chromosomal replication initiator protein DnaA [Aggregatilineales bacterium]
MNVQTAWETAYHQLALQLDRGSFETLLRDAVLLDVIDGTFVIGVHSVYARDMLQHRLYRNVRRILSDVANMPVELRFEVHKPAPAVPPTAARSEDELPMFRLLNEQTAAPLTDTASAPQTLAESVRRPQRPDLPESELNPRFTFERFVVAGSNSMAHEAARAVAENPGRNYNPFMVYSGVGLGKTHLLHAIAHVCRQKGLKTVYVPSEAFTNDIVAAIRARTTAMFREKYRSADVLLIDDVQFITGKDATQEEFFHTFNALYMYNKQIVIASDRHPRELTMLEDRLRSRFEGGLIVDIPPMEYETRVAILHMWAQERGVKLPHAVIDAIAQRARSNVRELEGAFTQVVAKSQLSRQPITMAAAETLLIRLDAPRLYGRQLEADEIIAAAAEFYHLQPADLTGASRTQRVNLARQVAMHLARELTGMSLPQIGEVFGGRTHTTVLHGCNKISEALKDDPLLADQVAALRRTLVGQ